MVLFWLDVDPMTYADRATLARGVETLLAHGGVDAVKPGPNGATTLGASSWEQFAEAFYRLKREFGVRARIGRPQVAYKVVLTRAANGEWKHAAQARGRREYAHVKLTVEPVRAGAGVTFENVIVGGAIPSAFVGSVEEGVREALARGVLAGYPIEDASVTLYDGSHHDVDSTAEAFRTAALLACRDAIGKAAPALHEPIMTVALVVAPEQVQHAKELLSGYRVEQLVEGVWGSIAVVGGLVPLADTFDLGVAFLARVSGTRLYRERFSDYAPIKSADDEDRRAGVTAPLRPRPPLRTLRASVPEPRDDWTLDVRDPAFRRQASPQSRSSGRGR